MIRSAALSGKQDHHQQTRRRERAGKRDGVGECGDERRVIRAQGLLPGRAGEIGVGVDEVAAGIDVAVDGHTGAAAGVAGGEGQIVRRDEQDVLGARREVEEIGVESESVARLADGGAEGACVEDGAGGAVAVPGHDVAEEVDGGGVAGKGIELRLRLSLV